MSFTPTLAPMARGILATCTAKVRPGRRRAGRREVCGTPTPPNRSCTCCPRASWPRDAAVHGSNSVHLQVAVDRDAGRVVVVAAVDNLCKGTAGAAVQCANIALGLPETPACPSSGWRREAPPATNSTGTAVGHPGTSQQRRDTAALAEAATKAGVLVEALPWLERFHGKTSS